MALEESEDSEKNFDIEGISFYLDQGLIRLINLYGKVRIDYRQKRWFGNGFRCRLGHSIGSC